MKKFISGLALFCLSTSLIAQTPWLHVDGNQIKDPAGNVVILRGIDVQDILKQNQEPQVKLDSLINILTNTEDSASNSPGWYPKVIRLTCEPVMPDFEAYYTNTLKPAVDYATSKGLYVIIDLHYIADIDNNIEFTKDFWRYTAPKFRHYSNVLYEVYNEPINMGMSWDTFKPYMQEWVDLIRQYAPHNLILAGSPQWSQVMGGSATNPLRGGNIVYVAHVYPSHFRSAWNRGQVEDAAAVHPVFLTEWGFWEDQEDNLLNGTVDGYGTEIMDWADNLGLSWTAWCADNDWRPPMFTRQWELRVGNGEMGGFVKDLLYEKRNDDQPEDIECAAPYLGFKRSLCGEESLNLNSDLEPESVTFTWYKDGVLLEDESLSMLENITEKGVYKVDAQMEGCVMSDSVEIIENLFPIDLGPDAAISEDSLELVAGITHPEFNYSWYKNGELLEGDTLHTLKISDLCGAVYKVLLETETCGSSEDEFEVLCERGFWLGSPIEVPGKVEAEHYDIQNVPNTTYSDEDATNRGGAYRTDGVDIEACSDVGRGYNIGYTEAGEWLEYSINVTEPGVYTVNFRTAANLFSPGAIRMKINDNNVSGTVSIPLSGGWQTWQSVEVGGIELSETDTLLRLEIITGGFNLNYVEFHSNPPAAIGKDKRKKPNIYPNPTIGPVYLSEETAYKWRVLSLQGTELKNGFGQMADLKGLPKGSYILMVEGIGYSVVKW